MKKLVSNLSVIAFLVSYIIYIVAACNSGGNLFSLFLYSLAFLFCIIFCGKFLQEFFLPHIKKLACLPIAFVFGTLAVYLSFIFTSLIGKKEFSLLIPFIIGSFWLYKNKNSLKLNKPLALGVQHSILFFTASLFILIYTICVLLPFAQPDKLGYFYYHQDMLWSVGNAASVYNGFPLVDMRFSASLLNYHYLNDALSGILGLGTGASAYTGLCFYFYPLIGLCLIVSLYAVALKACNNKVLCSVFPFIVMFVYGANSESVYHYLSNINGQGTATLALTAGLVFIATLPKQSVIFDCIKIFVSAIAFGFCISMFKSTIGGLFILAVIAACVVGYFTKKTALTHYISAVGVSFGFLIAYAFIFSNAVNNLIFNGFSLLPQIIKTLLGYSPIGFILYICVLIFSIINLKKLSFLQLVTHAMFVGGIVAFSVYYHYSASQIYFLLIAIPMMWLSCFKYIDTNIFKKPVYIIVFYVVILLGSLPGFLSLLPHARTGVQAGIRISGGEQFGYDESYISKDDYNAMVWLRQNTLQSSIFATNRNNKVFAAAEGTFHYYSAASQRKCYLESYRYCMDYSGMYKEVRRRLENVSDNIFQHYSEQKAFSLALQEKIDYLVVFTPLNQTDWTKTPVYQNDSVKIYSVK